MKKLWLSLSVGVGVGAIVAGSVLLAIYVANSNNNQKKPLILASQNENAIRANLSNVGNLEIIEVPSPTDDGTGQTMLLQQKNPDDPLAKTAWTRLIDKINRRLNAGPESGLLKRIIVQRGVPNSEDENGFYVGGTNEIYINTENYYQSFKTRKFIVEPLIRTSPNEVAINPLVKYDEYTELLAEEIFQVIYHEYGHHMAYVYLNSDNTRDAVAQTNLIRRIYDNDKNTYRKVDTRWDSDFLNTFISSLGYNSPATTPTDLFYTYQGSNTKYNGAIIKPLWSAMSLKEIFDGATTDQKIYDEFGEVVRSKTENEIYKKINENFYAIYGNNAGFINWSNPGYPVASTPPITIPNLVYQYSMEELYTRKMMQATMPFEAVKSGYGFYKSGYVFAPSNTSGIFGGQGVNYYSDFLNDTNKYADGIETLSEPKIYQPYYRDYLFSPKTLTSDRRYIISNNNAKAIYEAMLKRMGYKDNADISVIWWKNDSEFDNNSRTAPAPSKTTSLRFGGYIDEAHSQVKYIGYYTDEEKTNFIAYPITLSQFNFKVKSELSDSQGVPIDFNKYDKYSYLLDNYVNVNEIAEKELYFAENAAGLNAYKLTNFNSKASTDVDEYRSTAFNKSAAVAASTPSGGVKIKLLV